MSHALNELIPPAVHMVDMLNNECNCTRQEQTAVLLAIFKIVNRYEGIIAELEHLKAYSILGQEVDLCSDLLETFGPKKVSK
jgi:hypothetical protein